MLLRAYRFRFYPDEKQTTLLEKTLRSCCFLYNSALQEREYAYVASRKLRCNDQINELPQLKKALQNIEESIHRSCRMFFEVGEDI